MASGDVILEVASSSVSADDTSMGSGVADQVTIFSGGQLSTPAPWHTSAGYDQAVGTLGPVTLNVTRYSPPNDPSAEWPPETLFDAGKKYKITITEV